MKEEDEEEEDLEGSRLCREDSEKGVAKGVSGGLREKKRWI